MVRGKKGVAKSIEAALVPAAEQPYELPGNWCWVKLGKVSRSISTTNHQIKLSEALEAGLYPVVSQGDDLIDGYCDDADKVIEDTPVILFGDHTRKVKYLTFPFVVGADGTKLQKPNGVNSKWLYFWILYAAATMRSRGYARHFSQLKAMPVPLPPLAEQRRIVERVESLFAKLDEAEAKLRAVLDASDQRQSAILHAAFTGDESWEERALGDVCLTIYDGDHMPPPKAATGVPFLVISDVNTGCLRFDNARFVPQAYYDSLTSTRKPQLGDVLYTLVGSYGIPVLVDQEQPFCFQRHMALLKPDASKISSEFLRYLLLSPQVYDKATSIATGTAQLTVPIRGLRKLSFPIPPLAEQEAVVARLDSLLSREQVIADKVRASLATISTLRQTILARALRGELGTNDPAEASSLGLLEGILASKGGTA